MILITTNCSGRCIASSSYTIACFRLYIDNNIVIMIKTIVYNMFTSYSFVGQHDSIYH